MRIKLQLKTKQIPVHYRMLFVSFVKEAIKTADEDLYNKLYVKSKQSPKKYSFAIYLAQFQKKENVFEVDGITMTISSSDPLIAVAMINGFQQMDSFIYKNWQIDIEKIEFVKEKIITSNCVKFATLSPILLENKEKRPLLINDNQYEDEMNFICNQQFLAQYGRKLKRPLKIIAHDLKKQVIQESNRDASGRTLFFTGQKGFITLEGDIEDLTLLYQDGMLLRKSQGWGNLDVVMSYEGVVKNG